MADAQKTTSRQILAFRWALWLLWIPIVVGSYLIARAHGPEHRSALVVIAAIASNYLLSRRHVGLATRARQPIAWWLTFDLFAHTLVLSQLGGVANPAVLLYFPLVAVAGLAFPRPWIVLFAGFACAAHGLLLHYAIPLPAQLAIGLEPRGLTSRMILWAGFCACICITAYVAEAWRRAVADEQKQILQAERQAVRHANVAMATSLAAGAAHELGGPLATIAVASHELVRAIELADSSHDVQADVELISQEVKRARRVLDRLALAEIVDPGTRELVELQDFERELRSALETPQRVTIVAQTQHLLIHRVAVLTMIVSLLRNALSASGPTQLVALKIERQAGSLSFEVCDDGVGISPEILHELGKPFVRGNHQRHGFGLGVFLAKLIAEQLGGTLSYQSEGRGTVARLSLPENLSANATIGPFEDAQSVQGFLR